MRQFIYQVMISEGMPICISLDRKGNCTGTFLMKTDTTYGVHYVNMASKRAETYTQDM